MSAYNFEVIKNENTKIMCIFGCLLSERGKEIKKEMLKWLTEKYDVICVNQEYPGTLYEWPAMLFAKKYSIENNIPVLYLHTKGAFNTKNVYEQDKVRALWKDEFINNYDWYEKTVLENPNAVVAPFVADYPINTTWCNGFIAGPEAWTKCKLSDTRRTRFEYEHIFKNTKIDPISRVLKGVNTPNYKTDIKIQMMIKYINEL